MSAGLDSFLTNVKTVIINPIIMLLFALALAYFLWGVFEFISNQESDEKKTTGKSHMLWGIIGLTVMFGVFTLMNIVLDTFNIGGINPEKGTVILEPYNPSNSPRLNPPR